jgi:ABC-2 type transport system permease protein
VNNMIWLIRREVWENRSLWIAPLVVAGIILIIAAFGLVHVGHGDDVSLGWNSNSGAHISEQDRDSIRNALATAPLSKKQIIYAIALSTFTAVQLFSMVIVLLFYLLDSLLAERKDRSILFWKSLPVSDTEVVLSKLLTAAVVTPVFVLLVSSALQVLFAGVWSIRFSGSVLGDALMAWDGAVWLKLQASFVLLLASGILWYLPILTYLMVVSVWARRNAFLWAVLPPVSILAIEGLILQSNNFGHFLGRRFIGMFQILQGSSGDKMFGDENEGIVTVGEVLNSVTAVFTHYETWAGVLAAAAMIFAAIRIRRYRDDN